VNKTAAFFGACATWSDLLIIRPGKSAGWAPAQPELLFGCAEGSPVATGDSRDRRFVFVERTEFFNLIEECIRVDVLSLTPTSGPVLPDTLSREIVFRAPSGERASTGVHYKPHPQFDFIWSRVMQLLEQRQRDHQRQ